jgi:zinc transport system ATP-binding protein
VTTALLEARQLVIGRERDLFGPIDLRIEEGRAHLIAGPNGSGKSTLLRTLAGLLAPRGGRLLRRAELRVRWVGQEQLRREPLALTVRESMRLGRGRRGSREIKEALRRLGVEHLLARSLSGLSGGERSRVALASALLGEPELLFLDEPLSDLDPEAREQAWHALEELRAAGGSYLIVSHHDVPELAKESDAEIEELRL